MAVTYGFYNSSNGDRKYNALQFSRLFEGIIRDGVFSTVGGSLMVVAASNLTVNISPGRAWFNNTWTNNDALLPLTLDPAEAMLNRYDAIVLEVAPDERENRFKIVKGTPATTPAKPTMIKTGGIYQYPLAYIYVGKGVGSISQANISNAVGTTECPFITGALQQVTTNDIIAQWESEFNTWFDDLQAQLEGNVVTNLQNQINTKLTANGGDGKDVVVSFTEAATEANIASGEKLSTMFGKILKKLKNVAPESHASSANTYGVGTTENFGHAKIINNLTQSSHVDGTALSAYQGYLLDQQNISSYLMFYANINSDSLDSAFGKNNTDRVLGIGRQLAMYAWFKGDSKTTYPFTVAKTKNTLDEIIADANATEEVAKNPHTVELLQASPFARDKVYRKIPMPVSEGSTVIASDIRSIGSSESLSTDVPYTMASITAPYSGRFLLDIRYFYSSSRTFNLTVKVNGVDVYNKDMSVSYYTYRTAMEVSVAKNAVIEVIITNKYSSSRTLHGGHGAFLIADRPLTCTSASGIGNNPIWNIPNVEYTWGVRQTEPFVAPYSGTFRLLYAGNAYDVTETYFAIYKNGALYHTPTTQEGAYLDVPMNAGDTLTGYTKGNSNVNNGHSYFTIFAICKATNQNTFPY